MRLLLTLLGGVPPLLLIDGTGYMIVGVLLIFAVYASIFLLHRYPLIDKNLANRAAFFLPRTTSAGTFGQILYHRPGIF